jgi:hypothetical protein
MNEDLDDVVKRCASLFLSESCEDEILKQGYQILWEGQEKHGTKCFSRILQEIAAYKGGAVLNMLLRETTGRLMWLHENISIDQKFRLLLCSLSLVILARHKVVVEFCLRSNGNAVLMLKHFVAYLRMFYRQGFSEAVETLVQIGIEGLVNFAKASKAFRGAIIDLDASLGIFSALKDAFSIDHRSCFSLNMIQEMRSHVSRLMVSLTLSTDSQRTCLIDKGLIQILVLIYETTSSLPEHLDPPSEIPLSLNPAFRCNLVILRLLEDETAAEKLRLTGAFNALKPHQSIINRAMPNIQPWGFVEERCRGCPSGSNIYLEIRTLPGIGKCRGESSTRAKAQQKLFALGSTVMPALGPTRRLTSSRNVRAARSRIIAGKISFFPRTSTLRKVMDCVIR